MTLQSVAIAVFAGIVVGGVAGIVWLWWPALVGR